MRSQCGNPSFTKAGTVKAEATIYAAVVGSPMPNSIESSMNEQKGQEGDVPGQRRI
jgi:hypothetical protein